jgi:purine-binding chemotaxis protein CheW
MSDMSDSAREYVTAVVGGELIGLPILGVQDVFAPEGLTRVPLAPPEIAGVINLRGRIVTLIDLRCRLGMPPRADNASIMAIGVEHDGESFGLVIDAIGEVLQLFEADREPNPLHLDPRLARVSNGIHRLDNRLLLVLDIDRLLDIQAVTATAA